ncbi:MAG: hypothetical protein ACQETK_11085 [Pseudomonadota bacterium]
MRWPLALLATGIVLLGLGGSTLSGAFQGLATDFRGPGQASIEIPRPGDYRLWLYTRTYLDGTFRTFPDRLPDGTRVVAQSPDHREPIELRGTTIGMTFTSGQQERIALGHFHFPDAGHYTVLVEGLEAPRAFALREIRFLEHARRAALFMVPGVVLFVWGIIWLIVAAVSSPASRARRA